MASVPDSKVATIPAAAERQGIIQWASSTYGVEAGKVMGILRSTCFKVPANDPQATDAEVAALLIVARHYKLNPFLRQIYAFRQKGGGIVPIVGIDGWAKIINDEEQFDGVKFTYTYTEQGKIDAVTATIYRKDRAHPMEITEFYEECYRNTEPWNKSARRMLRHRAYIQCGRLAFGLTGIHDDDEGEVIALTPGSQALIGLELDEKTETTRTASLAHDLTQRAASNASEGEVIDKSTGEIKPVTPELLYLAIESAATAEEHASIQEKIMTLPAGEERVKLLTKWNERGIALRGPTTASPASGPAPSATAGSSPEPAARAEAGGASAPGSQEEKAPVKKANGKAAAQEPGDRGSKPRAAQAGSSPERTPAAAAPDAVDQAACDEVKKLLQAAKTRDDLDAVAARENKKKWPKALRQAIYDEYMRILEEKWPG